MWPSPTACWSAVRTTPCSGRTHWAFLTCSGRSNPYPEVYAAIGRFAAIGTQIAELVALERPSASGSGPALDVLQYSLPGYFQRLSTISQTLQEMAQYELQGTPFTAAHMAFVNQTVNWTPGCGAPESYGWYSRLFYESGAAVPFDPTIADVHTQPTDAGGTEVGRVLHVGTGGPRFMVVTVDTCMGPRAYAGLASSYHELTTDNYKRYTDQEWAADLKAAKVPATVPWLGDLIVP